MDRCGDAALKGVGFSAALVALALVAVPAKAADTVVQFEAPGALASETGSNTVIRVLRTGPIGGRTEVRWAAFDGSAKAGSDYGALFQAAPPSGVVVFEKNEKMKTIVVGPHAPGFDDEGAPYVRLLVSRDFEPGEQFGIRLSGPGVGPMAEVTVEIAAHGRAVALSNSRYDVSPDAGSAVLVVQRIGDPEEGVSVEYRTRDVNSVPGRPYTPVSGTLSWAPGDVADKTITVPLLAGARGPVVAVQISEALNATLLQPSLALVVR